MSFLDPTPAEVVRFRDAELRQRRALELLARTGATPVIGASRGTALLWATLQPRLRARRQTEQASSSQPRQRAAGEILVDVVHKMASLRAQMATLAKQPQSLARDRKNGELVKRHAKLKLLRDRLIELTGPKSTSSK